MYQSVHEPNYSTVNMKPSKETDNNKKKRKYEFVEMKSNQTNNVEVKRMKLVDGRRMPVLYFKVDKEKTVEKLHGSPTAGVECKVSCPNGAQCSTPCNFINQYPTQQIEESYSFSQPKLPQAIATSKVYTSNIEESTHISDATLVLSVAEKVLQENIQLTMRIRELEQCNQNLISFVVQNMQREGTITPQ